MEVLKVKFEMETYLSKNNVENVQHSCFISIFSACDLKMLSLCHYIGLNGRIINE
jgi:hypothetical protein